MVGVGREGARAGTHAEGSRSPRAGSPSPAPTCGPLLSARPPHTPPATTPAPGPDDLPTFSPTGQKIDARTRRQLEAVLDDDNLTYNGVVLDGEDKEKVKKALELIFWDAKEKNKRKK